MTLPEATRSMSALSPSPPPPAPIDPAALRLVLFGMSDAGKSSLLGALAQAAETQARALHGHLNDPAHGLEELRKKLYDDRQTETQQEIVPYPVRFSPYGQPSIPAVLYDCDGKAANELLTQKRPMENREGTLAGAVLNADGLILAVDASAPHSQIEDDFREFLRFLRFFESHRSKEQAVGGLPVYLVLTKCDLLTRDGTISHSMWEARIAERKHDVMEMFKAFLVGHGVQHGQLAFGTLDLEVRATAVRRPSLTDVPPQPREPYGVAELFYTAFAEAGAFRERHARSRKRLNWMVASVSGFLLILIAVAAMLFVTPERTMQYSLADRVEAIRASEGPTAATRLGPNLDRRLKEWQEIQLNSQFGELPDTLQNLVRNRMEEGQAYVTFRDALAEIPPPIRARSLAELSQTESRLSKLIVPAPVLTEWQPTEAVQQRELLLNKKIPAVRAAVGKLTDFYIALSNGATALLQTPELSVEWEQSVRTLAASEKNVPLPKNNPESVTAFEYDEVAIAMADWQKTRDRLFMVRDLARPLGLIESGENDPLAFPPPAADADIPSLGAIRWQRLKAEYPTYSKWTLNAIPDALRPSVEKRLHRSIDQAIRDGQRLILDRWHSVKEGRNEMPADWGRIGDYLLSPALKDWRELNAYLFRLADPMAADPVESTARFMKSKTFELEPKQIKLRIPDALSDAPVRPIGDIILVLHRRLGDETIRLPLRLTGDPVRDKQTVVYTFAAEGSPKLTYRPGDTFFAELAVRKGDRDLKLTWASSRTVAFQFERLLLEPRFHSADQSVTEGLPAVGVQVRVTEGQFPIVPAMMPIVGVEKK